MDEKTTIDSLEIISEMAKVSKLTNKINDKFYKRFKLTRIQFTALGFLYVVGETGYSLSEISEKLDITKPSASTLIDRMVKLSMVERVSNKEDRRRIRIIITSYGKEIMEEALKLNEEFKKKSLSFLTEEERLTFYKLLLKIKNNLIKYYEE